MLGEMRGEKRKGGKRWRRDEVERKERKGGRRKVE